MHALVLATLGAAQRRGCAQHFPKSALPFFRPKVCISPAQKKPAINGGKQEKTGPQKSSAISSGESNINMPS